MAIKNSFNRDEVLEVIKKQKLQNLYLYIDAFSIGLKGDNIDTYVNVTNDIINTIIYVYYNSVQLIQTNEINEQDAYEIAMFCSQYNRISGPTSLIDLVNITLKYKKNDGHIMQFMSTGEYEKSNQAVFANVEDIDEIARMICNDKNFANTYNYDSFLRQMKNRFLNENCKSLIIKKDDVIVSHFGSFADYYDVVVLSGMITREEYRGKGLGSILVKELSNYYLKLNKIPVLYCYEDEYYTWYQKLGYKSVSTSSKLEKIR